MFLHYPFDILGYSPHACVGLAGALFWEGQIKDDNITGGRGVAVSLTEFVYAELCDWHLKI